MEKSQYQKLVEKLIYLSHTRPDIAYVASVVNQFMHDPRERHLQDILSTSRYCIFLGGNLVTWRSKKQNVVVRYSAEAEFRAMTHDICE
ncbi:hypothetical protein CR513_58905, partial [Mucuna pruriens]